MATTRKRFRTDGSTAYNVMWRDPQTGKQRSQTFDDSSGAETLRNFLNANGQSFALAVEAAADLRSTAPRVRHVVAEHIDHITGIEPGTRFRYRKLLQNHIDVQLGSIPVDRLKRSQVLAWFEALPVADKTRKNIHALLSASLETAVSRRLVTENVAKGIRGPKSLVRTREPVFMSKAQVEVLADTIDPRYSTLIRFFAASGLRYSEATALRRRDVRKHEDGRYVVHVTRAWKKIENGFEIGGPKSPKSRRTVALQRSLTPAIAAQLDGLRPDDLVFQNTKGDWLRSDAFRRVYWLPTMQLLLDREAEPYFDQAPTPHDLRHTHASWLIEAGVPLPVIQVRLGHESITTTVDTYGHLAIGADSKAADLLG
jgi:integrase